MQQSDADGSQKQAIGGYWDGREFGAQGTSLYVLLP